jgi:plasmid stabilization system protein ParE
VRKLTYLAAARQDLVDILSYITRESGSLAIGRDFVFQLRQKCVRLANLPGTLGQARPELGLGLRSTSFQNYVIFFRYVGEGVEVINVLHGARDVDGHFGQ